MNLLTEQWIPVRPLTGGGLEKISLRELLCGEKKWEICLPRDDMELAAMQLLICITQVILTPQNASELRNRIAKSIAEGKYNEAIKPYNDWFQLNHPKFPFMQVPGVPAQNPTPMDKLLTGVTGATNSCFVNQAGLAEGICSGCTAVVLFNQASCAPSFGGGFKPSLRGFKAPVTTLVQGDHLRRTIWLNVLSEELVSKYFPWHADTKDQKPTWMVPIKASESIPIHHIGFSRGLLWQPDHIELLPPVPAESCSCCGCRTDLVYIAFNKAKFNYTITGIWPHPHSPRTMSMKEGQMEENFVTFTGYSPAWTQLSRFVVQQEIGEGNMEGQQPAAVIIQTRELYGQNSQKLHLLVGGYRNKLASVLERRHDVFTLNHGWDSHTDVIHYLVSLSLCYRDALNKAIYLFVKGIKTKDIKGAGVKLNKKVDAQFYRRSEPVIDNTLARIDFDDAEAELARMRKVLRNICEGLFSESIRPYLNDPELIHTLAVARRTLYKHLNNLEPSKEKGEDNGATKTP